ncbi:MAG TPA: tetratricopeptide repeat protein [Verrucomicrobiae bacterium]|nr:tetratricopeptide repeat protein [Verrucomicrobiae bacterium]
MRNAVFSFAIFVVATAVYAESNQVSYHGAAFVLKTVSEQTQTPTPSSTKEPGTLGRFHKELAAFSQASAQLPPKAAVAQWLALADKYFAIAEEAALHPSDEQMFAEYGTLTGARCLIAAVPPPVAWENLKEQVEALRIGEGPRGMRTVGLRLLVHSLTKDSAAQQDDIVRLDNLATKGNHRNVWNSAYAFEGLARAMTEVYPDPQESVLQFEHKVHWIEQLAAQNPASAGMQGNYHSLLNLNGGELEVPDLVTLAGPQQAEALLRRALVLPVTLRIPVGDDTIALARKLSVDLVDKLHAPQWSLCLGLDALPLYEAMDKRFAAHSDEASDSGKTASNDNASAVAMLETRAARLQMGMRDDFGQQAARSYYFLALIAAGRTKDAIAMVNELRPPGRTGEMSFPEEAIAALDRAGYNAPVYEFLHDALMADPNLPFWDQFIILAARVGKPDEALALVQQMAHRKDIDSSRQFDIRRHLVLALLAADRVDEGVAELREILRSVRVDITNTPSSLETGPVPSGTRDYDGQGEIMPQPDSEDRAEGMAERLVVLGQLLKRDDWIQDGLLAMKRAASNEEANATLTFVPFRTTIRFAKLLEESGRGPEAEAELSSALSRAVALDQQRLSKPGMYEYGNNAACQVLVELVGLYHRAGRHTDVLVLADTAPWWGATDMRQIMLESDTDGTPVSMSVADALADAGRKGEARQVINALLECKGGYDPAYKLLLQLGGDDVSATLDGLFHRDQFEERPLIWKANLLLKEGRLDEAEKVVRQAIRIDPTDGEEGPGDRLRAYAQLADILVARGRTNDAAVYSEAVKTVRMSEEADRYQKAGLLKRAVAMYEESLTHFADAYCVEARIGLRLMELGRHQEAEEHYRRAYELMPDSFGRMETHCFGCERVFGGQEVQSVAEKVFTQLVAKTPDKPQVHYLLGYLREEEGQYREALEAFRTAVKLDHDYINAWSHIQELRSHLQLTTEDRDAAAFNLLRLDPQRRHTSPALTEVSDLRALWTAVEEADKLQTPQSQTVYILSASKTESERIESKLPQDELRNLRLSRQMQEEGGMWGTQRLPAPGVVLAQHRILEAINSILDASVSQVAMESTSTY